MRDSIRLLPMAGALLLSILLPGGRAEAQLPSPSAAFLGMGENHTAIARGADAVSLNPAGLAMPDGPMASASFLALRAVGGLGPIGLGDLARFDGREVPDEVRLRWLERITAAGSEEGSAGGEVTWIAAQLGRFGAQVATSGHVVGDIGPGAAEILLFGNAGRTGEPVDLTLDGTALDVVATSTVAGSYGHAVIREPGRSFSVGATLKYTIGHVMVAAVEQGGRAGVDPLEVRVELPVVQTDSDAEAGGRGSGLGLDLGVAWRGGPLLAGLVVRNVFNTFAWKEENLLFRAGAVTVAGETRATDFDPQPFDAAPPPVRARVRDLEFPPAVSAGVAFRGVPGLTVSMDARHRLGDGAPSEPASHLGVGAEFRPLPILPLRAGVAVVSGGFQLSGGLGVGLGPVRADAAAARRSTEMGSASLGMLTFSLALP